jgi:hypothetical protein
MSRPPATVRCDSIREARLRSFHTCIAPPLEPTGTGCKMNRTMNLLIRTAVLHARSIFAYRHTIRTRREEAKSGCGRSAGHQYKVLPHRKL